MPYGKESIPYQSGMYLGYGVNMMTGQGTSPVVLNLGNPAPVKASSVSYHSATVQTVNQYSDLMNITANAEGQAWTEIGQVGLKTSAAYLRSKDLSSETLCFSIYKSAVTQQVISDLTSSHISLEPAPKALMVSDPAKFLATYGTHFIQGFIYGGSFLGTITISAHSAKQMQEIDTQMSASINAFDAGNGKVDSSFKSLLQTYNADRMANVDYNIVGAEAPQFSPSSVDAMQTYVDNTFIDQLGNGVQIIAVCQPWAALPAVQNLPGVDLDKLSPAIPPGALEGLRLEYRKLEFTLGTALNMQANKAYVGPQSQVDLSNDITSLQAAKGRIANLTFSDVLALDASGLAALQLGDGLAADLDQIAAGRATIFCNWELDKEFNPNSQGNGQGYAVIKNPPAMPDPNGSYVSVLQSSRSDGSTVNLGFIYAPVQAGPGQPLPPNLQDQVQLTAVIDWKPTKTTPGSPAQLYRGNVITASTPGVASKTHWESYDYDTVAAYFD